ncbi:CbiQ family ECF transporter T component [Pseudoduganella albidiflava]|uniref:Cobalt ECF transporter T component CbiQ n=1 Tax=Pseudoduganella albidiflava TaxID=321983 RepID=A0A411X1B8_9BURK|nr:CbiQ family ECF transporter T component [Pseudoduganella albidiflava]QBI02642.1 cobalt ECF transporter T component CbiQ [Pseudoduganella albidiflava]GGY41046.1 cobalt ECF transporter T component CbiQ [Pseudoduganella albidiflava]
MLVETAAYASRWRGVAPSAKALFALAGIAAAWIACRPATLAVLALLPMLAALLGARVPLRTWLAVARAPLGFLLLACATLPVGPGVHGNWQWNGAMVPVAVHAGLRALAVLAALLGFVLTTPLPDLLSLLRRLRTPEVLLDLMALCYRMLFVLRRAWDDGVEAQRARLGYPGWRHGWVQTWRSTGLLAGHVAQQVWLRAAALQVAADARSYTGTLRFLPAAFPRARRQNALALLAGALLVALALGDRW